MEKINFVYVSLILSILNAIFLLIIWQHQRSLNKLKKTFFSGRDGKDLEDILLSLSLDLKTTKDEQLILEEHLTELRRNFQFAIQKVGIVRFNPFADTGGNLSFALALLDGKNNGLIITNMHSRDYNRIYLKKILYGKSETQLTNEELQAIDFANASILNLK